MKKSTRSILQELSDISINKNQDLIIDCRGANIIQSAINLINLIKESYDPEIADDLERRFINSIKSKNPAKFNRGIKLLKESKK